MCCYHWAVECTLPFAVWGCPVNMDLESDRKRLSSWFPCVSLWLWTSQLSVLRFSFLFSTVGTKASCALWWSTVTVLACPWVIPPYHHHFLILMFLGSFPSLPGCPCGRPSTLNSPTLGPWHQCSRVTSRSPVTSLSSYFSLPSHQPRSILILGNEQKLWGCCLPTLCWCFLLLH